MPRIHDLQHLELPIVEIARLPRDVPIDIAVRLPRGRSLLVRSADVLGDPEVAA